MAEEPIVNPHRQAEIDLGRRITESRRAETERQRAEWEKRKAAEREAEQARADEIRALASGYELPAASAAPDPVPSQPEPPPEQPPPDLPPPVETTITTRRSSRVRAE